MLAYVFWHRPAPGVDAAEYERALAGFHRALASTPPDGFVRSFSHRFAEVPWLGEGGAAYEDWYLAAGWTAVGQLETGAVSGPRRGPHDRAAFASAEGAGAVYGLAAGALDALASGARAWFTKPEESAYHELDQALAPALAGDATALWRRRLVLGPAPEHCLAGPVEGDLPPGLDVSRTEGTLIHSP